MQPWPADSEEFEDMLFNQAASSDHLRQLMKLEEEAMERSMLGRPLGQFICSFIGFRRIICRNISKRGLIPG